MFAGGVIAVSAAARPTDPPQAPTDAELHTLAMATGAALGARRLMAGTAESCTGGWIGKVLTEVAGSSDWFQGAAVTYSNHLKRKLLGVRAETLAQHGAVSGECAREMVAGVIARLDADVGVAVTGIAGPGGGTAAKPVGTVWIAWQRAGGEPRAELFRFAGDRDAVRRRTVAAALDGVRKTLTP